MAPELCVFHLKVLHVEQLCLFELSWGKGQRLTAQLNFPASLGKSYQNWRHAYVNFYQSAQMRGRKLDGGILTPNTNWYKELTNFEANLLKAFNRWLRGAELYEIRSAITKASHDAKTVQIFLTCGSTELDRFPWEAWELGTEIANKKKVYIIRAPLNIGNSVIDEQASRRPRILAILGDETGLDFRKERHALKSLFKVADVEFVGWQPGISSTQIIKDINSAIVDERGWDILFFAGHSNECEVTGGEIGVAPQVSIPINQIASKLTIARERGLKVAIFNSCSGLNIADALINLGFSQVIVMREPIHNNVAQEFLVSFLRGLAKHLDIYESMLQARQVLLHEGTYPSSFLIPSLFCHPGAKLFRIPSKKKWQQQLKDILPTRVEAVTVVVSLTLCVLNPVHELLLDTRLLFQAAYRDITSQIPNEAAPVALVEIDTQSILNAQLHNSQLYPMNRSYLAKLIERANELKAPVISLDFLIDAPQDNIPSGDKDLKRAVNNAVNQNIWFIFGTILNQNQDSELDISRTGIYNANSALKAYTDASTNFIEIPTDSSNCREICPISYLMALVYTAKQEINQLPQPRNNNQNLRTQLLNRIEQSPNTGNLSLLSQLRPILGIFPLVDYSIPPDRVYTKIPAHEFLNNLDANKSTSISKQVVLIAAGDDKRLGMAPGMPDQVIIPSAMSYWVKESSLTGGQSLAYATHHFMKQRLVFAIPDILMLGTAIIFSKIAALTIEYQLSKFHRQKVIASSIILVILYGIMVLQIYISVAILFSWLLPSSIFLAYVFSATKKSHV